MAHAPRSSLESVGLRHLRSWIRIGLRSSLLDVEIAVPSRPNTQPRQNIPLRRITSATRTIEAGPLFPTSKAAEGEAYMPNLCPARYAQTGIFPPSGVAPGEQPPGRVRSLLAFDWPRSKQPRAN